MLEVRTQKSDNPPSPPFSKRGMGGFVLWSVLCIMVLVFSGACKGKADIPKAPPAKAPQAVTPEVAEVKGTKVEEEVYVYDRKDKRDPFVSLVVTPTEEKAEGKLREPLLSYDVGAIKVLGIVWDEKGYYAAIVLPDGKAYTLREGMTVGLHDGKIQSINENSIVVKENIKDYKGEVKPKETILKLREEEEE